MEIVAIIACRNEEAYLGNCLSHLTKNGIKFAILDNGSEDATAKIAHRAEFARSLAHYEYLPFGGSYRLQSQLARKAELAQELTADWVIHHDADEIMHSYNENESLAEAIHRLSLTGADVINFDEFVFLPLDEAYVPDLLGMQRMRRYYFFEPQPNRLMRLCKPPLAQSFVEGAGHKIIGSFTLAPETLALRHYIFRDQEHAFNKYAVRNFDAAELARGWHFNRAHQPREKFAFPPTCLLNELEFPESRAFDKSNPKLTHYWQW